METLKDKRESLEGEWYYLEKEIMYFVHKIVEKIKKIKEEYSEFNVYSVLKEEIIEDLANLILEIKQKSGFYEDEV